MAIKPSRNCGDPCAHAKSSTSGSRVGSSIVPSDGMSRWLSSASQAASRSRGVESSHSSLIGSYGTLAAAATFSGLGLPPTVPDTIFPYPNKTWERTRTFFSASTTTGACSFTHSLDPSFDAPNRSSSSPIPSLAALVVSSRITCTRSHRFKTAICLYVIPYERSMLVICFIVSLRRSFCVPEVSLVFGVDSFDLPLLRTSYASVVLIVFRGAMEADENESSARRIHLENSQNLYDDNAR